MTLPLQGKIAIVTGGSRGIGRASAIAYAEAGADVAICHLDDEAEAKTLVQAVTARGRRGFQMAADMGDVAQINAFATAAEAALGPCDILLNNAGMNIRNPFGEITEAEFDGSIALNLKSCFNYIQAVVPQMRAQGGGRIASMSSLNALSGGVTAAVSRFAYASAKAGILGMTRALAKELGPDILVNAICPGLIKTELAKNPVIIQRGDALAREGIALGRVGSVEDVAQVVLFLATSEPCFVTGQHFVVDGFQYHV
jgi:3-oxoacyl-[acyl-carrier protein] reductase